VGHRPWGIRTFLAIALCAVVVASLGAASHAAVPARKQHRPRGLDARVIGTFNMVAHVTVATNVRGEHVGQVLHRVWEIVPERCRQNVCQSLQLDRERSAGLHNHLTLRRVSKGYYVGRGVFYVRLRCQGRVYRSGSRVPFTITLTVRQVTRIQGFAFARNISATYNNPARSDSTPCPLGPSHDAGRYSGTTTVPIPPVASFISVVNALHDTASFSDTSARGGGAAGIVAVSWSFGDPASGAANSSTLPDPSHQFSAPGIYQVSLTVLDKLGLSSTSTQDVTAPGPPHAAFTFTPIAGGITGTYHFADGSTPGIGGARIVAWGWNFGDPNSRAANTSTLEDPTHTFTVPGIYTVTLAVVDANGYIATTTEIVSYPEVTSSVFKTSPSSDSSRSVRTRPGSRTM
jgi:PKD repeat protein